MTRILVVIALLCAVPTAHAQKSDKEKKAIAKEYVDAGLAAEKAGDYDAAVDFYKKAYDVVPHPILWFNIGQAHRLAGRDEEALAAYQTYLEEDPKGAKAKDAKAFIKEITPRVERLRAERAENERKAAEAEAQRKAAEDKRAEAERKAADEEAKRKAAEDAANDDDLIVEDQPSGAGRRRLGLIVGASGLVVAATGGVFGYLAMSAWSDAEALCGDDLTCDTDADTDAANALADDARLRGNVSTVMVGVGAAALIGGVVLYLTAPSGGGGGERAVSVAPTRGGAMVTWGGAL